MSGARIARATAPWAAMAAGPAMAAVVSAALVALLALGFVAAGCGGAGAARRASTTEGLTGDAATAKGEGGVAATKSGSGAAKTDGGGGGGVPGVIARAEMERLRAGGAGALMARVDMTDVRDGARFVGWRVRPRTAGDPLFGPGGLAADDVVVRVNGLPLGHPDEFMFAWEVATTSPEVRVELLRGGVPLTLVFAVR
ncbi:MAG TPA: hypothetical protein VG389_28965 [Myxococcota bacterium]|jgi:hypothetical protein|nr:hypothetical protein [Myxococcota bacterium]